MADEVQVFDVSDIANRAFKTFLQAGLGSIPFVLITDVTQPALVAAGIAAASAALAVVFNAVAQYAASKRSKVQL